MALVVPNDLTVAKEIADELGMTQHGQVLGLVVEVHQSRQRAKHDSLWEWIDKANDTIQP